MTIRFTITGLLVLMVIAFTACQKEKRENNPPDVEPLPIVLPELHFAMYDSVHRSFIGSWPNMVWDSSKVSLQRVDTVYFDTAAVHKYLLYCSDTFSAKGDYYYVIGPRHTQGLYMEIRFRGDTMLTHNVLHGGNGHGSSCDTWGLKVP